MRKAPLIFLVLLVLKTTAVDAQSSYLARVDCTTIPRSNSDIEYSRTRVLFNYPIKLKKGGIHLFLGLDYSNINLIMD